MTDEIVHRHRGKVNDSAKLFLNDIKWYQNNLDALQGKNIYITIQEEIEPVSKNFHNYYRGIVLKTALQSETFGGWTSNELHEYYVDRYLVSFHNKQIKGQVITLKKVPSTASIGTKRMTRYVEDVKNNLAQEHGIIIKDYEDYDV